MRLFTGIDLPRPTRDALEELLRQLRPSARVRWSPVENLHITTKFIGEWPEPRLTELKEALEGLKPWAPFRVALRGLGYFPNPHQPRVFWVGVVAPPALEQLALATEEALEQLGVAREKRPFSPHLTLARMDDAREKRGLLEAVSKMKPPELGEFAVDRFYLYLSEPSRLGKGSVYTKLAEYRAAG